MADFQTPTEVTLLSTSNPAPEQSIGVSKEAGIQVSFVDKSVEESKPTPTTQVNGDASIATTNGVVPGHVGTTVPEPAHAEKDTKIDYENDPPLFSPSLISPEVSSSLPEGYSIRPLRRSDYYGGFLPTLRVLTAVGEPTLSDFNARYDFMYSRNDTYHILVICDESGMVVGTGSVLVERKFIRNMGMVGHIEDIAVAKNQQGKKLGLRIIQALDYVAEKVGCYKSILDCSEANEGFYVKCGFKRAGLQMAHYYPPPTLSEEKL